MYRLNDHELMGLAPLFEGYFYNQAMIYGVLEGRCEGEVWVDDPNWPGWALVRAPFDHVFVGGRPPAELGDAFKGMGLCEAVVHSPGGAWDGALESALRGRGIPVVRRPFELATAIYRRSRAPELPEGGLVELIKEDPHSGVMERFWSARFLLDGRVVSLCSCTAMGAGFAEIEAFTHEEYRGRGYALHAARALMDQLLEEGLTPTCGVWLQDQAAQNLARKLYLCPMGDERVWILGE